jgi:uncharacterized heparinase superfamily protein
MTASQRMPDFGRAANCLRKQAGAATAALFFRLPFYDLTLAGRTPRELRQHAPDPWPGVPANGEEIVAGRFTMGGETVFGDLAVWGGQGGPAWQEAFHSFEWLRDLRALGGEAAHQRARKLIKDWTLRHERWSAQAWRGDVLGRRLSSWISHYDFFTEGADAAFREHSLSCLAHQARHLARAVPGAIEGAPLLSAVKGLVLANLALHGSPRALSRALDLLCRELARQILADGGHIQRCPSLQMSVLRDLIDIRGALMAAQSPVAGEVQQAIDRMAPMLRFFRLGDGGLAVFNGGEEEEGWFVDLVLSRAEAKGKPLAAAPHSGFQRCAAGRGIVAMDAGMPARLECARGRHPHAHAGTLSFELSLGKDRVVMNCGTNRKRSAAWSLAARSTAAHSTLVIEDTNSAEVSENGLCKGPVRVTARRTEAEDGTVIESSHDGYVALFGLIHRRRLRLSSGGDALHGEDALIVQPARRRKSAARKFAVRFHLHPDTKASLMHDGKGVLLKLPSGAGARFTCSGGETVLEDSVYLGDGNLRRASQIVVSAAGAAGASGEAAALAWSFARM